MAAGWQGRAQGAALYLHLHRFRWAPGPVLHETARQAVWQGHRASTGQLIPGCPTNLQIFTRKGFLALLAG